MKKYRFVPLPPPAGFPATGIDIFDCLGGTKPYVVKRDINGAITCSCEDFFYRYGNRAREGFECKHAASLRAHLVEDQTDLGASDDRPLGPDCSLYRSG